MPNPWLNEHKSTAAMNYFLNKLWASSSGTRLQSPVPFEQQDLSTTFSSATPQFGPEAAYSKANF